MTSPSHPSRHGSIRAIEPWTVGHDFIFANGGAETVTKWFCLDVLPGSPLVYLSGAQSIASTLTEGGARQVLPRAVGRLSYRLLSPLIPPVIRASAPLEGNLLASSYAFISGLRVTGAKVVYCHSPLRQAWSGSSSYSKHGPAVERLGTSVLGGYFRRFDRSAAHSADRIVATSRAVQQRIRDYYGRDAPIVAPPFDDETFHLHALARKDVFVWAGRVTEPYKQLGIVLDAFRALPGRRLVVVGDGRDRARLERDAPSNATFVGWRSRRELAELYASARALIMPSEDDFGLVAVEAMACGAPVIAYAAGGALDTVDVGRSGLLFDRQDSSAVISAVQEFERSEWDSGAIADDAARQWGRGRFTTAMREVLDDVLVRR